MGRSDGLDAVRGTAIGMVLLWHFVEPSLRADYPSAAWTLGLFWSGVDLFFVLSGFLIGGILIDARGSERILSTFYARRALRIIPLYAFLLLVTWRDSTPLLPYLTFTQNFATAWSASWEPVALAPTWSLAVEEQFYLLLPVIVILMTPARLPYLLVTLIALGPVARLLLQTAFGNHFAPYVLLPGRMDALFMGAMAAWMVRQPLSMTWLRDNRARLYMAAGALLCALILLSRLRPSWFGTIQFVVGYSTLAAFYTSTVLLVATASRPLPRLLKPLSWMGLGAYSLYLFHMPVYITVKQYSPYPAVVSLLILTGLSVALWHLVEAPLIAFGRAKFRYGQHRTVTASSSGTACERVSQIE